MGEIAVRMPKFSMAQQEGTLISWVKHESDVVSAGDVLCEVATDKVDMEVEAPVSGTLTRLLATEDQTVAVGEPIAYIASDSADLLDGLLDVEATAQGTEDPRGTAGGGDGVGVGIGGSQESREVPETAGAAARGLRALPGARRRAAELGLSLGAITGTGPGQAVTTSDVEAASAGKAAVAGEAVAGEAASIGPTASMRSAASIGPTAQPSLAAAGPADDGLVQPPGQADLGYAELLADLRRQRQSAITSTVMMSTAIPQFTMFAALDLELAARQQPGREWTALLARVLGAALRQSPALNVTWRDGRLESVSRIGVAIAADTPVGMLAPVLADPDRADPVTLDSRVAELKDCVRNGTLGFCDLGGATVMLCDLGSFGVEAFQVPVTPPLVAALSVGVIGPRPVVAGGGLATRTMCQVGLTVDHRVADAADAARFLRRIRAIAANPDQLREGPR
jgi:pyruvate dehydrogenase E2 component (dihydrolipoamide acetyltransferase)